MNMKKLLACVALLLPIVASADYYIWSSLYSSKSYPTKQIDRHSNDSHSSDTVTLSGTVSWSNTVSGSGEVSSGFASSTLSISSTGGASITKSITYTIAPGKCKALYGEALKNYKRKYRYRIYTATDTSKKVGTAKGNKYTSNGSRTKSC
jgi:hypothetical protein